MRRETVLFWGACIPTRTFLTLLARQNSGPLPRLLAAGPAFVWLTDMVNNNWPIRHEKLDKCVWWADERQKHGFFWAAYSVTGDWRWLAADTVYGGLNWLMTSSDAKECYE